MYAVTVIRVNADDVREHTGWTGADAREIAAEVNAVGAIDEDEAVRLIRFRVKVRRVMSSRGLAWFDDMAVTDRQWSADVDANADGLEPGTPAWYAAIGDPATVVLTGDGRHADTSGWCACGGGTGEAWMASDGPLSDGAWVRYERYTAQGLDGHGYVHAGCRRLLQVG